MTAKLAENAYAGRPLHFIGHLQRNKVRQVVGKADLIQSVGSTELLQEIEKAAGRLELCQDILLEVNIGGRLPKAALRRRISPPPQKRLWPCLMSGSGD